MSVQPLNVKIYHVFLASPGDVNDERKHVRRFFDDYNRHTAHLWNAEFKVIDWENYATIGVGRPQEIINRLTLEKFKSSLALVVGIMAQRFGSPTGNAESGTEEEFNVAKQFRGDNGGFPEIKWFFRKITTLELASDPDEAEKSLTQWKQVRAFRLQMQNLHDPVFYTEYPSSAGFAEVFNHDLNLWMNDPTRPWAQDMAAARRANSAVELPPEFNSELYRTAVSKRFDKLNFEMLDSTGAFYNSVRLWSVFIPQSARECHQYNPKLLEIPKEHQQRLLEAGEISPEELKENEAQADALRQAYFQQPLRPVLEIVDQALRAGRARNEQRLVILGDPGSGKSSLIRYLALRWSSIDDLATRDTQPIPLVIDLGSYGRWQCEGQKGFIRFLEESPVWHSWPAGLLARLLDQPGRMLLLLDGLDEIFDPVTREAAVNDIQRFSTEYPHVPIVVTSRVVGYQSQRLRDADFRHFMLQDLDAAQIESFIHRWHEQTFEDEAQAAPKRERLKKAVRDSKAIGMLAGNPLLLTLMAILNRNQELPRDRVDLYAQASRLLLHQWDTERALAEFPGLSKDIGWREKHDMLLRIAAFMQAGPSGLKGNMIAGTTLTSLIEDYLHTELHFPQARAAARAVLEHLRQRSFILCFVGADSYSFVHRTFLEYYCAADIVQQFNVAKSLDEAGLIALFDKHCRDDDWREVLRLICSQIDEQFVGRIVEHLATRTDLEKWDRESPLPELPLAIYCFGEVRKITKLEFASVVLLKQIINCCIYAGSDRESGHFLVAGGNLDGFFRRDMRAACNAVEIQWPSISDLRENILTYADLIYHEGGYFWAFFVASTTSDREITKQLIFARNPTIRGLVLLELTERWPDNLTMELLRVISVKDKYHGVRSAALQLLAEKWPDDSTRRLLRVRAVKDDHKRTRGAAASVLGSMHSLFGDILQTKDLDGVGPYLDPLDPIPREHLEKAAEKAGIATANLEAQIASLNQHLGWDITKGARPKTTKPQQSGRRKK